MEHWCRGLAQAYLLPPLSVGGASLARTYSAHQPPLIESRRWRDSPITFGRQHAPRATCLARRYSRHRHTQAYRRGWLAQWHGRCHRDGGRRVPRGRAPRHGGVALRLARGRTPRLLPLSPGLTSPKKDVPQQVPLCPQVSCGTLLRSTPILFRGSPHAPSGEPILDRRIS